MNYSEYQEKSKRTLPKLFDLYPAEHFRDIVDEAHMLDGMTGELLFEVIQAFDTLFAAQRENNFEKIAKAKKEIIDEVGDWLFYTAGYCTFRNIDFSPIKQYPHGKYTIDFCIGVLHEYMKKRRANIKFVMSPEQLKLEHDAVRSLIKMIDDQLNKLGITMETCMELNYQKLSVRFKESYTPEEATHKNREAESKVFK